MQSLEPLEIGLMFWAKENARETLQDVKSYGVRAGQLGFPGELDLAGKAGLPTVGEAFADRAYTEVGTLVPRGQDGAVVTDPEAVVQRSVGLARSGVVTSHSGSTVEVRARSLCLHGDTPGAVSLARAVRAALKDAGVPLAPFV